ncbi:DUF4097 family beta strand repeat-containing protein [Lysobacter sp. M15]|uniref:DUF4097 family beta strand repeat-containing protein n=1 Tax=Lysobacter sp. M15 TaxID=2916837 RepID=UPI001F581EDB|nr:DUF4097 family beta strand repeat-containing protein [Lysobacter sp. M15]
MIRFHLLAMALLAGIAAPAFAVTPINQTRPLDARGKVEIENVKGRIEVHAWNRNEVQVTGTLGDGVEKLEIDGDRGNLRVKAKYPERGGWGRNDRTGPTTLILQVPLQASLDIESVAADVHVDGVAPPQLDIQSVSGDIVFAGAPGAADIDSVSGNQTLTLNSDGDVSSESVSGDVTLRGRLKGALDLETVSGNVEVDSRGEAVRRLSASSVSGDIGARVGLANGGEIRGETVSGNFSLHMPRALSAEVEVESFSGSLKAPGAKVDKEEFGPGSSLRTRYGSGAGEIRVETFSGDFTLSLD